MQLTHLQSIEKKSPFDSNGVSFNLDGRPCQMYFDWDSNGGEKWTFDICFNHPDVGDSLQGCGEIEGTVGRLLEYSAEVLGQPKSCTKQATAEILTLAQKFYDRKPQCTPEESYYGI